MEVPRLLGLAYLFSTVWAFDAYKDIGNDYPYVDEETEEFYKVPEGFMIGAGSAAYQTEGAWNEDGKGESIWDHFFHNQHPNLTNGDVACDSYHKYKDDVRLVKNMKLDFYRISLSWPRLLPDGTIRNVNQKGVDFYNNFINEMINNGITPVITLYHWDLPQALQLIGGWRNATIQDYFRDYASFAFKEFGDRVKYWATFNEPHMFCSSGYESGTAAPGISDPGVGLYECAHNVILSHAKAYQTYYNDYPLQGGYVGITMDFGYQVPLDQSSEEDQKAAQRAMEFNYAWFSDPIMFGRYPESMRQTIDDNSKAEGRSVSRLPEFTDGEKDMLQVATDFLGVNHYSSSFATPGVSDCVANPSNERDISVLSSSNSSWNVGPGWSEKTPWGIRGTLNWVKDRYKNFPTFLTENGYFGDTAEGLNDFNRVSYLSGYIRGVLRAVNEDNCNVMGYSVWSLLDNLEWTSGLGSRFGVSFTNFDDPNLKRTPKKSANFMRQIMTQKKVTYYPFNN